MRKTRFIGAPAGPAPPTVAYVDTEHARDLLGAVAALRDTEHARDVPGAAGGPLDTEHVRDGYALTVVSAWPDTAHERDAIQAAITWPAMPPSGTPDADPWGDAWTDALATNTGVNHGTTDPLQVLALAAGVQQAYWEIDLTRLTGFTASGGATFTVTASSASLLAQTITFNYGAQASRPFVESTIKQTNEPATPSLFQTTAAVGASAANAVFAMAISDAQLAQLLGKWVLIVATTSDAVNGQTIHSREAAVALRPQLALNVKR